MTATETEREPIAARITGAGASSDSEQQGEQQAEEALARRAARSALRLGVAARARIHEVFPPSVHAAAARCASSPPSPTRVSCARSSRTWASRRHHRLSRRPGAAAVRNGRCRAGRSRPASPTGIALRIRSAHRLAKAARGRFLGTRAHPGGRASGTTMIDRQHEPPLRRRAPFSRWRAARRWRQKGSGGSPAARPFAHKRHRDPFASDRIREGQNQPHRRSARRNWPGSNWPGSTCRTASLPAPTSWASAPG